MTEQHESPPKNWSELGYKGGQILQHTTQNIKDWATPAPLNTGVNSGTKGVLTPFVPEFTPVFSGARVAQSLMFCVVCCSIWPPLYPSSLQFVVGVVLLSTTTHYTEHKRPSNTNPTKNWSELGYKGGQILQHTTQNIKDWATPAPLNTGENSAGSCCSVFNVLCSVL
jgi:hypothetical protein